jgi:hypothetical protein
MQELQGPVAASGGVLRCSKDYLEVRGGKDGLIPKDHPMQEQTKSQIDAAEALAILEQAYAYYQPEPVLVHDTARDADEEPGTCVYYQAA